MKISLPDGRHEDVCSGVNAEMISVLTEVAAMNEKMICEIYGEQRNHPMPDVVCALAYANISRMAWSLCSAARIEEGEFDPVEFGKRCEAIAREQIDRYRTAFEQAGRA